MIQLGITKKNLKYLYINKYVKNKTFYNFKKLQKKYIHFKENERKYFNLFENNPRYSHNKQFFNKKFKEFRKRKLKFFKTHGYHPKRISHWMHHNNLKKLFLFPSISLRNNRIPYINYLYRHNLYFKRILKNFYFPLHPSTPSIESRLDIILVRSHFAISIKQAQFFIKNNFITTSSSSIYLKPGDKIIPHRSLYPIIFKNFFKYSFIGSKIPSYLIVSPSYILLIDTPTLDTIPYPNTLNKK